MTLELTDTDSFEGEIADDGTETLAVDARRADVYQLMIDDGAGNNPPTNDVDVYLYSTVIGDYMLYDSADAVSESTPPVDEDARGEKVRIELTNTSGGPATFRVSLETFRRI